jgi:hypothetical protein
MIIEPDDVPDSVTGALGTWGVPVPVQRKAGAAVLAAWEEDRDRVLGLRACRWEITGVQHATILVKVTHVLQRCAVHGELRTEQLNGHWTLADLAASPVHRGSGPT